VVSAEAAAQTPIARLRSSFGYVAPIKARLDGVQRHLEQEPSQLVGAAVVRDDAVAAADQRLLRPEREVTYAEAEPWLAGRDRPVFERRFASRLRDPAFRNAMLPNIARYPAWDRLLNPEKYAPKATPVK